MKPPSHIIATTNLYQPAPVCSPSPKNATPSHFTTTKRYYSIAGMMVAMHDGTDLVYFASDHLFSASLVMGDSGTLQSENRYMPFGEVRDISGVTNITETDFGYTGQRNLEDIGLMDYDARFYSPTLMRFIQPDTIVADPSNQQNYNKYTYVLNNPLIHIDPSGHKVVCTDDGQCFEIGPETHYSHVYSNVINKPLYSKDDNPNADLTVSDEGLEFIMREEGNSLVLYNDSAGNCTIGIGILVHFGPCNGQESELRFINGITEEQALELFREKIPEFEGYVKDYVLVPLTQYQFDALVSFVYNVGPGKGQYGIDPPEDIVDGFTNSDLIEKLNDNDYAAVPSELMRWTEGGPGLVGRREREGILFMTGDYGSGP